MTYGVPYSFVPGTKAKADEVNANFIDVLEKISNSNTRITSLESGKADTAEIDGHWEPSAKIIANNVSLNGTTNLNYNLSDYLPSDGEKYEVMLFALGTSSSTNGQFMVCYIGSDIFTQTCIFRQIVRNSSTNFQGGNTIIPVGTGRKLVLRRDSEYFGTVTIYLIGYRKVR